MSDVLVHLPSGAVMAIEVQEDVADAMRPVAGSKVATLALDAFRKGISAAGELAEVTVSQLAGGKLSYQQVEMEFGITFTSGADVKIVRAESSATIKLVIRWNGETGEENAA